MWKTKFNGHHLETNNYIVLKALHVIRNMTVRLTRYKAKFYQKISRRTDSNLNSCSVKLNK